MAVAAETWTGNEEGVDVFLARAASGDDDAVAYLYRRYVPALVHYAQRRGAGDAEGVADLAFLDAINALPSLRSWSEAVFRAYAYRATRSRISGDYRRNTVDTVMLDEELDVVDPDLIEDAVISQRGFDDLLQGLSPGQRDVIVHRFLGGFSVQETAARLGRTPGAVKQLQFQGLTRIRAAFAVAVVMVLIAGAVVLAQTSQSVVTDAPTGVEEGPDTEREPVSDLESVKDEESVREPFSVELESEEGQIGVSSTTTVEVSSPPTTAQVEDGTDQADDDAKAAADAAEPAEVADPAAGALEPIVEASGANLGLSASGVLPTTTTVPAPSVAELDDASDDGGDDVGVPTREPTTTTAEPPTSTTPTTSVVQRQGAQTFPDPIALVNGRSGRCLTAAGHELGNLTCGSFGSQQVFEIINVSNDRYQMLHPATGKCAQRGGFSGADDGAVVVSLESCADFESQQWRIEHLGEGLHKVRSIATGYCLDVDRTDGAVTDLAFARVCDGTSSQKWTFYRS